MLLGCAAKEAASSYYRVSLLSEYAEKEQASVTSRHGSRQNTAQVGKSPHRRTSVSSLCNGAGQWKCQFKRQSHFQGSRDDPSCPKPRIGHEGAHREPREWLYQSSRHSSSPNHQNIGGLKIYHSIDIHATLGPGAAWEIFSTRHKNMENG